MNCNDVELMWHLSKLVDIKYPSLESKRQTNKQTDSWILVYLDIEVIKKFIFNSCSKWFVTVANKALLDLT